MNVTSELQAWSRFTRAHSVFLEAPLPVAGYVLATGELFTVGVLPWLAFGMLYHYVGYGMNSYTDWKGGFDKDDESKQHHPLNTGEITERQGKLFSIIGMTSLLACGLVLVDFSVMPTAVLLAALLSGTTYNYLGKKTVLKATPLSIVHTLIFAFPYVYLSDSFGLAFFAVGSAYFLHNFYQTNISGDVKDIKEDEANVLRWLGTELKHTDYGDIIMDTAKEVQVLGYTLSALQISVVLIALLVLDASFYPFALVAALSIIMIYEADATMKPGVFNRESRVMHMAKKEISSYMLCHTALYPIIGAEGLFVWYAGMLSSLMIVSKFTWGNWIKPEV